MFSVSKILLRNIRPLCMLKDMSSSMATLSSPTATYTGTVADTLTRIYNKYQLKNDIIIAKTACQAAKFLDDYLIHHEQTKNTDHSMFLCHTYHTFVKHTFNTFEIVENDSYTTNTNDLENIHYNIYTNTRFNEQCGSETGLQGETSLYMISFIAQKDIFDYDITFDEFKRHAIHVDTYIGKLMKYLKEKHLAINQ